MAKWTTEILRAKGLTVVGGKAVRSQETFERPKKPFSVLKKMTECESRWYKILRERHPAAIIIPQFRLRAGSWDDPRPVHYTGDFAMWEMYPGVEAWACTLWEVKDKRRHPHSDELVRPKLVRQQNPWIYAVWLAQWDGENWEERKLA